MKKTSWYFYCRRSLINRPQYQAFVRAENHDSKRRWNSDDVRIEALVLTAYWARPVVLSIDPPSPIVLSTSTGDPRLVFFIVAAVVLFWLGECCSALLQVHFDARRVTIKGQFFARSLAWGWPSRLLPTATEATPWTTQTTTERQLFDVIHSPPSFARRSTESHFCRALFVCSFFLTKLFMIHLQTSRSHCWQRESWRNRITSAHWLSHKTKRITQF